MQSVKLDRQSPLKLKSQTLDLERWDLLFALLGSGLSLVLYFLTMPPIPLFQIVMHNLNHYMLEVCNLHFDSMGTDGIKSLN